MIFQGYTPFMCSDTQLCPIVCDPIDCLAPQGPLFMGFSGQEYWNGLPFPPAENSPNPGIEPVVSASHALAGGFFTVALPGKPSGCLL